MTLVRRALVGIVPFILTPLPYIAQHIIKPPVIGNLLSNGVCSGFVGRILFFFPICGIHPIIQLKSFTAVATIPSDRIQIWGIMFTKNFYITRVECCFTPSTAGIFPLGFTGQSKLKVRNLFVNLGKKLFDILKVYLFYRPAG